MFFIVYAKDKAGALDIRKANRTAHLEFLKADGPVKVRTAGPLLSDDTDMMIGSTLILEAQSLVAVNAWLKDDPYAQAGLSECVSVHPFVWAIGNPDS